ncbi:type III secretion system inner rod subunit SctI [Providencia rettgeri]
MPVSAIEASHALDNVFLSEKINAIAEPSDIQDFAKHLMSGSFANPEHQAVDKLQKSHMSLVHGIQKNAFIKEVSPEKAVEFQTDITNSMLKVDTVAKVAGLFSVAINKLVSMQ